MRRQSPNVLNAWIAAFLSAVVAGCGLAGAPVTPLRTQSDAAWAGFSASAVAAASMAESDDNHNGKLSPAEAGMTADEFAQADQDRDGQLTSSEIVAFSQRLVEAVRRQAEAADAPVEKDKPSPPPAPTFMPFGTVPQRNQSQLLLDADQIYPAMIGAIRSAQRSVQLDYFLLGGSIGKQFADALIDRVRAGVDVTVMLDGWAPNQGGPTGKQINEVLDQLKAAAVPQHFYPLSWLPHNSGRLANHFLIDHDKLLVIDQQTAFVGSMNLFDLAVMNHDLMVRLEGPMAQELSTMMDTEWQRPHRSMPPLAVAEGPDAALVRGTKTDAREQTTKTALLTNMARSTKSVYTAIYDFSDLDVADGLIAAKQRGLDVRVLVDRHDNNDKYFPLLRYFNIYGIPNLSPVTRLIQAGVPVRWFDAVAPAQELHMKMTVFDGAKAMLGSTNYTFQAFNNFRETGVEIEGGRVAEQLHAMFLSDWDHHASDPRRPTFKDRLLAKLSAFMERQHLGWW